MEHFVVDIPEAVVYDSRMNRKEIASFLRKLAAIGFYLHENVSLGYCAQIAGMAEEDFICLLGENHISVFRYMDEDELLRDIENA